MFKDFLRAAYTAVALLAASAAGAHAERDTPKTSTELTPHFDDRTSKPICAGLDAELKKLLQRGDLTENQRGPMWNRLVHTAFQDLLKLPAHAHHKKKFDDWRAKEEKLEADRRDLTGGNNPQAGPIPDFKKAIIQDIEKTLAQLNKERDLLKAKLLSDIAAICESTFGGEKHQWAMEAFDRQAKSLRLTPH